MKFVEFLKENKLDEGLGTQHGKVESVLREKGYKYEMQAYDHGKVFKLSNGYLVYSNNSGQVSLTKQGIKGFIASVDTVDFNKIRTIVLNMLDEHIKDGKKEEINKDKKTA